MGGSREPLCRRTWVGRFNKDVMWSSKTGEWETPQDLFDELDEQFRFTLDVCATHENTKVPDNFFTKLEDGLNQDWGGNICWMNPPYGRGIDKWIRKAFSASLKPNTKVVCLLPSRTDTKWFHSYCAKGEIWFLKGRLKFGGAKNSAPFPSMIVIFAFPPRL